jgi:hypothetical protein
MERRIARCWQHNFSQRDLSSHYPSMVVLYFPKRFGELHFVVYARSRWEMSPTKKLARKHRIILFFTKIEGIHGSQ